MEIIGLAYLLRDTFTLVKNSFLITGKVLIIFLHQLYDIDIMLVQVWTNRTTKVCRH